MVTTETPTAALGWAAPDFMLPGVDGAEHRSTTAAAIAAPSSCSSATTVLT